VEFTVLGWGIRVVLAMFDPGAHANICRYFHVVDTELDNFGITDPNMKLVAYATIRAEAAAFAPVMEHESKFNTVKIPQELTPYGEESKYNLYELRDKTTKVLGHTLSGLGNDRFGDGAKYMGRGFVQLTGKENYLKYGQLIGVGSGLVENPKLANDPQVAAQVLAAYMAEHYHKISHAIKTGNLPAARRAVNGGLNGLAAFERAYNVGAKLLQTEFRDMRSTA
jgi:peptidoglycan L-alanyl-D-glutamate endopeptidase CwlK